MSDKAICVVFGVLFAVLALGAAAAVVWYAAYAVTVEPWAVLPMVAFMAICAFCVRYVFAVVHAYRWWLP